MREIVGILSLKMANTKKTRMRCLVLALAPFIAEWNLPRDYMILDGQLILDQDFDLE
jgi:hypothetical protein